MTRPQGTIVRTAFRTSRLLDFTSKRELTAQIGHDPTAWPLVVLKELLDNALDACEEAQTPPVIGVAIRKPAGEPRRSKARELDEQAARGVMPVKPDVTSRANHHYQKRFDRLAELAAADDWDAVAAYECNGVNTYAKMVRQYRDRLVAAHAAQPAA